MPTVLRLLGSFLILLFLSSCADQESINACVNPEEQAGFLSGILHGFFAPLAFIWTVFSETIAVYDVNNSGGWYDFGFLLGIGGFSGGVFKSSSRRKN